MSKHTKQTTAPVVHDAATKVKATASVRSMLTDALRDKLSIPKSLAAEVSKKLPAYLGRVMLDALEAVAIKPGAVGTKGS